MCTGPCLQLCFREPLLPWPFLAQYALLALSGDKVFPGRQDSEEHCVNPEGGRTGILEFFKSHSLCLLNLFFPCLGSTEPTDPPAYLSIFSSNLGFITGGYKHIPGNGDTYVPKAAMLDWQVSL